MLRKWRGSGSERSLHFSERKREGSAGLERTDHPSARMVNSAQMEHVHENMHGLTYYWEYIKRFGKESSETWWKDFVISLLLAVIPVLLAWGDRTVLQGTLLAVEAVGLLFGAVALRHLVHTSLILFRERTHPAHGGIRHTHWSYGVWGAFILLALVCGVAYGAFHGWLRRSPPVVLQIPAPAIPAITTPQIAGPPQTDAARRTKAPRSSPQAGVSEGPIPNAMGQVPSQPSPQAAQSPPPATFLDRVVRETAGSPPTIETGFRLNSMSATSS
jgi:hypothetical protein